MQVKFWLCSFAMFFALDVNATAVVVKDYGNTVDLGEYVNRTEPKESAPYTQGDVIKDIKAMFPLHSTIPVAKVSRYSIKQELPQAIALVGTGELSQAWLNERFVDIQRTGAAVIVIDAPTNEAYRQFSNVLREVGITVTHGDSRAFEGLVKGYPVLVANGEVYQ